MSWPLDATSLPRAPVPPSGAVDALLAVAPDAELLALSVDVTVARLEARQLLAVAAALN